MVAMQSVVEPGQHARGIAEGGMLGDVRYPLAVDPHLTPVVEAVEKLLAGVRQLRVHIYRLPAKCHAPCPADDAKIAERDGQ